MEKVSTQAKEQGWGKIKKLYRIGIPADLHTPQLQPAPGQIQLC